MAGKILTIGTPSAFENSVFQLGRVLVVSMISAFGTVHISANAVANSLDSIGCIFGQAISLAMIIDWICRIICFVWRFNWLFAKPSRILPNTYDE